MHGDSGDDSDRPQRQQIWMIIIMLNGNEMMILVMNIIGGDCGDDSDRPQKQREGVIIMLLVINAMIVIGFQGIVMVIMDWNCSEVMILIMNACMTAGMTLTDPKASGWPW